MECTLCRFHAQLLVNVDDRGNLDTRAKVFAVDRTDVDVRIRQFEPPRQDVRALRKEDANRMLKFGEIFGANLTMRKKKESDK
jgi:hypothetical protein